MSTRRAALLPGLLCLSLASTGSYLRGDDGNGDGGEVRRVLVISLDGTHALDVANYIHANPHSTLAGLSASGTTYTNAYSTKPSDSIPSTSGIFTGGTPAVTGMWYDDA